MKLRVHSFPLAPILLLLVVLSLPGQAPLLRAASAPTNTSTKAPVTAQTLTNSAPQEVPIPLSVFLIPASPKDGKDPFFPDSSRLTVVVTTKTNKPATGADLVLKGISGAGTSKSLASINNHSFGPGEEGDVLTSAGRVRIRCLEIREESVLIEMGGQQQELRFPRTR